MLYLHEILDFDYFFQFRNADDAKKALEQLNGFELAGRPMKVGNVTERTDLIQGPSLLDTDELDRSGIDLGATGRYIKYNKKMYKKGKRINKQIKVTLCLNICTVIFADYN